MRLFFLVSLIIGIAHLDAQIWGVQQRLASAHCVELPRGDQISTPPRPHEEVEEFQHVIRGIVAVLGRFSEFVIISPYFLEQKIFVYYFAETDNLSHRTSLMKALQRIDANGFEVHLREAPPHSVSIYGNLVFKLTGPQARALRSQGDRFFNLLLGDDLVDTNGKFNREKMPFPPSCTIDGICMAGVFLTSQEIFILRKRMGHHLRKMKMSFVPQDPPQGQTAQPLSEWERQGFEKWFDTEDD